MKNLHYRFTIMLLLSILLLGVSACGKDKSNSDVSYPDSSATITETTVSSDWIKHDLNFDLVLVLYLDTSTYERYIYSPDYGGFYHVTTEGKLMWSGRIHDLEETDEAFFKRFEKQTTFRIPADDLVGPVYLTIVTEPDGHTMLKVCGQTFELY